MLNKALKQECIKKFCHHDKDTGSPEVQISLFTKRIGLLTEHLKIHKKDYHSRKGLFVLIGQRRSFLNYLMKKDINSYYKVVEDLGIRK